MRPDGTVKRKALNPETHRASQARAWKAKTEAARIRREINLTQESFATMPGVSLGTVRKWERGEEVIIARRDKPVVRLSMVEEFSGKTRIGGLKTRKFKMGAKFDDPALNAEIAKSFNARPDFLARQQAWFGSRVMPDSREIPDEPGAHRY